MTASSPFSSDKEVSPCYTLLEQHCNATKDRTLLMAYENDYSTLYQTFLDDLVEIRKTKYPVPEPEIQPTMDVEVADVQSISSLPLRLIAKVLGCLMVVAVTGGCSLCIRKVSKSL